MKKLLGMLIFVAVMLLGSTAHAWKPSGWHYMQWPYVYSIEKSSWMYLNEGNSQWYYDFNTGTWSILGIDGVMDNGWTYFLWPYAYTNSNDHWHYVNEASVMWTYSFANERWSKLGVADELDIKQYADTIMALFSQASYSVVLDQLVTIIDRVLTGSSSTCPTVTETLPLADVANTDLSTVITADYGTGCTPSGTTSVVSGSATATISNVTAQDSTINADYSLSFNNLAKDATLLGNGTVSGSVHVVLSDTGLSEASITLNFVDLVLLNNHFSGQVSLTASNVNLVTGTFGPITVAFDNFSAGDLQINGGTVVLTSLGQSVTQVKANLTTSQGAVDVTFLVTISGENSEVIQVRTPQAGTIAGYTVAIKDVTLDSTICSRYPSSGTITFTKGGSTTSIGFTNACDGTYIYTEN